MKKNLHLNFTNFSRFASAALSLSDGINVLIGENGTGKTHLLKALYATSKATEEPEDYSKALYWKLNNVFQARGPANLITENAAEEAKIRFNEGDNSFILTLKKEPEKAAAESPHSHYKNLTYKGRADVLFNRNALYIPPQEILTTYFELRDWQERFEHNFEETYLDLARAIARTPVREAGQLDEIHQAIQKITKRKTILHDEAFFVEFGSQKYPATLLAEGIKKFVLFDHLIRNRTLNPNTTLFIDEPEVHFNPKYITWFTDLLISLANKGVQIHLATHDYLLTHYLSLKNEYRKALEKEGNKVPDILFHSIFLNKNGYSEIESSQDLVHLKHNAILNEYTALYNKEQELFKKTIN